MEFCVTDFGRLHRRNKSRVSNNVQLYVDFFGREDFDGLFTYWIVRKIISFFFFFPQQWTWSKWISSRKVFVSAVNFTLKISLELLIEHLFRFIKNTNKSTVGEKKLFTEQPNIIHFYCNKIVIFESIKVIFILYYKSI